MDEIKLSLNKLLSKYDYLECYLEEINFKYSKYNSRFLKEYYELNPQTSEEQSPPTQPPPTTEQPPPITEQQPLENDKELDSNCIDDEQDEILKEILNKLYKKLSLKTHPDKHGGNNELFIEVLNAYKTKNVLKLIKLSNTYKINYILSDDIVAYVEKDINKIEAKIDELQHHVCWLWCNASEEEKKNFKLP